MLDKIRKFLGFNTIEENVSVILDLEKSIKDNKGLALDLGREYLPVISKLENNVEAMGIFCDISKSEVKKIEGMFMIEKFKDKLLNLKSDYYSRIGELRRLNKRGGDRIGRLMFRKSVSKAMDMFRCKESLEKSFNCVTDEFLKGNVDEGVYSKALINYKGIIGEDIFEKAKYTKRTGSPGSYKYEYGEKKDNKQTSKIKDGKFFKEIKGLKLNQLVSVSEDADYEGQDTSWTETFTGVKKIGKGGEWVTHKSDSIIREFLNKEICLSPKDHSGNVFDDNKENNLKLERFTIENKIEVNRDGWKRYVYAIFLPEGKEVDTYGADEYRIDLNNDVKIQYVGYEQDVFLGVNNVKTLYYTVKPELKKSIDFDIIQKAFNEGQITQDLFEKAVKSAQEKKVAQVMHEFKAGTLKSGSGKKVTDREQAIAIAMSEAGMSKSEDIEPTEAQKKAGNYKKEKRKVRGLTVSIENKKGSVRSGENKEGEKWEVTMTNDYGYFNRTLGKDGDHVDVFLSNEPEKGKIYVIDQLNDEGEFDEHKVMMGFRSEVDALKNYKSNYKSNYKIKYSGITEVSEENFKKWLNVAGGGRGQKRKPFAELKKSLKERAVDILLKTKYIKRTGSPGNYKYEYELPKGEGKVRKKKEEEINAISLLEDYKIESGYLVVRFSDRIEEDLKRGWSGWMGERSENYDEAVQQDYGESLVYKKDNNKQYSFYGEDSGDKLGVVRLEEETGEWVHVDHDGLAGINIDELGESLGDIKKNIKKKPYSSWDFSETLESGKIYDDENPVILYSGDIGENKNINIIWVGGEKKEIDLVIGLKKKIKDISDGEKGKIEKSLQVLEQAFLNDEISERLFLKAEQNYLRKGRTGIYSDNPTNKRLNRVGQRYGAKKQEDVPEGKKTAKEEDPVGEKQSIDEQAKNTSGTALEIASKESKDSEVRVAAHKELERREKEEKVQEKEEVTDEKVEGVPVEKETVVGKTEDILAKYKEVALELRDFDFKDQKGLEKLMNQQKEYSRYLQRTSKFKDVNKEKELKKVQELLGLKSEQEIKGFFGDGDIIGINVDDNELISILVEDGYMSRWFDGDEVTMDEFILNPDIEKGVGKGTEIFSNQVDNFRNKGYKKLNVIAAKSDIYNGYYTWARLGYDLGESMVFLNLVEKSKNKQIRDVDNLSELMSFPEGRNFWKEEGFAFDGEFDLAKDSKSSFLLEKYMEEKKEKGKILEDEISENSAKMRELTEQLDNAYKEKDIDKIDKLNDEYSKFSKKQGELSQKWREEQSKKEGDIGIPKTKEFKNVKEQETYYNEQKKSYTKILSEEDKKTLGNYLEDSTDINSYLRTDKKVSESVKNDIKVLDDLFKKKESVLKDDLTIQRVIGLEEAAGDFFNNLKVGDEYKDGGFVSTTLSGRTLKFIEASYRLTSKVINLNIIAKKGSSAVLVDSAVEGDAQFEYLLNRGSKFKVISKDLRGLTVELM